MDLTLPDIILAVSVVVLVSAGLAYRAVRVKDRQAAADSSRDPDPTEPQFFKRCPPPS